MTISILAPHIAIGTVVLAVFWGALLSAKGSRVHKRFGRIYLLSLAPILASVVPISAYFAARSDGARVFQLGYLGLVVTTAAWTAWRAIRDRGAPERFRGPVFRTLAGLMLGTGALLLVLGLRLDRPLTIGFSSIGLVYGGAMLFELLRPIRPCWWKIWHLNGVSLLFAATHASFVGVVGRTLFPAWAGETMHTATQLGTIAFAFVLRHWLVHRYVPQRVEARATAGARNSGSAARR
jgi:hypothetical protein